MRCKAFVIPMVAYILTLCCEADVALTVKWHPRGESVRVLADSYYKLEDDASRGIVDWACFATLQAVSQSPSSIQLDPFAEHLSSRAPRW